MIGCIQWNNFNSQENRNCSTILSNPFILAMFTLWQKEGGGAPIICYVFDKSGSLFHSLEFINNIKLWKNLFHEKNTLLGSVPGYTNTLK